MEPFAGSGRYALTYHVDRDVWLNDIYPPVYEAWKWIVAATRREVASLPVLKVGEKLSDLTSLSVGERALLSFSVNAGAATPHNQVTHRARNNIARLKHRLRVLKTGPSISHWRVTNLSYADMGGVGHGRVTWYIDPPYQHMGEGYAFGSRTLDYGQLAAWCLGRAGQVIVCEGAGADWLPFVPLFTLRKDCMRSDQHSSKAVVEYPELVYHRPGKVSRVGFGVGG